MTEEGRTIEGWGREVRAGLIGLAAPVVAIGGWALLAPHTWYEKFPVGGRHWISALGPYDEHLVRDFGSLYLALGLLLLIAAVTLDRLLVRAVLAGALVFEVPHFVFHVANTGSLSTGDNVVNLTVLGVGLILSGGLLWLTYLPRAEQRTTIEGGITYGTR